MNLLIIATGLALASQAAAQTPPYFYCEVTRTIPFGNVTVLQYVSTMGTSEAPVTTWFAERAPDGTVILAAWHNRAEMENREQGGSIYFGYRPPDATAQYLVEVAPVGSTESDTRLRSELQTASANGVVGLRTHWVPVVALLGGDVDLEVRVLNAEGTVIRRDRIEASEFARSLRIAGEIQPEFEAMIANYRERCMPTDSNGR